MNSTGTPEKVNSPDTEVEWYDFGSDNFVTVESNRIPGLQSDAPNMAALSCVRNGLLYFKIIEGTFTDEDLPSMFKEYAPAFKLEVERKAQETQQCPNSMTK